MRELLKDIERIRSAIRRLDIGRRDIVYMVALSLFSIVLELGSVGMIYPLFVLAQYGGDISQTLQNAFVQKLAHIMNYAGVPFNTLTLFLIIFVTTVSRQFVTYKRGLYMRIVEYRNRAELQKVALGKVVKSEIILFYHFPRGQIFSAIRAHSNRAASIAPRVVEIAVNVFLVALYFFILFVLQPQLSLLLAASCLPVFVLFSHVTRATKVLGEIMTTLIDKLTKEIYGVLDSIRLVKLRGMEDAVSGDIFDDVEELRGINVQADRLRMRVIAYTNPIVIAAILGAIYLSFNVLGLQLAELGIVYLVIMRIVPLVTDLNGQRYQIYLALHAVEKMFEVIGRATPEHHRSGTIPYKGLESKIEFCGVDFQYVDPDLGVKSGGKVEDISFTVEKGEMVGLVGASGAGKSTIVDLLTGFYEPDSGQILIDGQPLRELDLQKFRQAISYVTQDRVLINGTLRENLEFGLPAPLSEERLMEVLKPANCWEFVQELPHKWDTEVRDGGMRLSGGQRQRLSIACALANRPDVLILDEPTSALDSTAEHLIHETLQSLKGWVTTIIIAHRLSTIKGVDKLVVLDQGRIVSTGSHDELIETSKPYQNLFESQMHL